MQSPCEEGSLACGMIVWQSAAVEGGHEKNVGIWRKILAKVRRPIANRPQVSNLPHKI
jgi:hypothetical protein